MDYYSRDITAKRLRELRLSRNWSLREMGDKLNALVGGDEETRVLDLDGDNGKQTVSQFESATGTRVVGINAAMAYATIFDVSLDYIYGFSDNKKPELKEVTELTDLSDDAVKSIIRNKDNIPYFSYVLNMVLKHESFGDFIAEILYFKYHRYNLDMHSERSIEELADTYRDSFFLNAEKDYEKQAARSKLIESLKRECERERWLISYKLGLILDDIDSLDAYAAEMIEEWVDKAYARIKRGENERDIASYGYGGGFIKDSITVADLKALLKNDKRGRVSNRSGSGDSIKKEDAKDGKRSRKKE